MSGVSRKAEGARWGPLADRVGGIVGRADGWFVRYHCVFIHMLLVIGSNVAADRNIIANDGVVQAARVAMNYIELHLDALYCLTIT
jgi:hypothetical protein